MKRSTNARILTTHVGSLPDESRSHPSAAEMRDAATDAVVRQREIGLDVINDGEHTKNGDWLRYIETRLTGFEPQQDSSTVFTQGRDREVFADYYANSLKADAPGVAAVRRPRGRRNWMCVAPITYIGSEELAEAIQLFKSVLKPGEEAFLTSTAPGSLEPYRKNQYYKTHEEFLYALAEALRTEYRAIVDAGLLLAGG